MKLNTLTCPSIVSTSPEAAADSVPDVEVVFRPLGRHVRGRQGKTVIAIAHDSGIDIVSTCGGRGRCTSCRIKLLSGSFSHAGANDLATLGADDVRDGFRLACQTVVTGPSEVQIAPLSSETAFQILTSGGTDTPADRPTLEPGIWKVTGRVTLPTDENHQTSEVDAILAAVELDPTGVDIPLDVLRCVPDAMTEADGVVTLAVSPTRIIALEAGDTRGVLFGLAIDIGTTSVLVELVDLTTGEARAVASRMNAQTVYGGDIMSRIAFAKKSPTGTRKLHSKVINLINELIDEVCERGGAVREHIYRAVVVGNTCMHHLFLGVNPSRVGFSPYSPILRHTVRTRSRDLGLNCLPTAEVILLPNVGGFVGADAMAMILSTGVDRASNLQMAVDIGTNGEVVLGSAERLMVCSAPAGPALEGAQVRHGMRASLGAIDKVSIDDDVRIGVIGDVQPSGICGSGMVDALAACLDAGILNQGGLLRTDETAHLPPRLAKRLRVGEKYREIVLAWAEETAVGHDVVLTQDDIRQLQLAKGAIASGIKMLQRVMGIELDQIERFHLAGGFGNYLNLGSAQRIGLIPPLPRERVVYVGNAALAGARRALVSSSEVGRAERVAREIEHVAIGFRPDFQEVFLEAVAFP